MKNIEHIVYLMLENRSLDNVLGWLYSPSDPPAHVIPQGSNLLYDGLIANKFSNKDKNGVAHFATPVNRGSTLIPSKDPHEKYEHVNFQLFENQSTPRSGTTPTMGGFFQDFADIEPKTTAEIMETYTPTDLPVINGLAKNYAVSDAYFSSVPTQTNCNRAFAATGNSLGHYFNKPNTLEGWVNNYWGTLEKWALDVTFNQRTIWNVLADNNHSSTNDWMIFYSHIWPWDNLSPILEPKYCFTRDLLTQLQDASFDNHFQNINEFFQRAANGTLPAFSFLEPAWFLELDVFGKKIGNNGNDYHPPANLGPGEIFLNKIHNALKSNQQAWEKTLFIINFDEHGGTYDHVTPGWNATTPWADPADGTPTPASCEADFGFDRFGVRVPLILISPYIESSTVFRSNTNIPFDHCSIIATVLNHFQIPKSKWLLGSRVANAPTFENVLTRSKPRTMVPEFEPVVDHVSDHGDVEHNDLQLMIAHRTIGTALKNSYYGKDEFSTLYDKHFRNVRTVKELGVATLTVLNALSKTPAQNDQRYSSPEHTSQELMLHPELTGVTSTNQEVCFGPSNNGWFTLFWSAAAAGAYDWIGLYKSIDDDDNDYIGGNNWQWASKGSSYVTSTACQPGYEARYLIWDANSKQYKSVARTGAFPEKICSK